MRKQFPVLIASLIVSMVALTPLVCTFPTKFTYNASASAPVGFYWIDADSKLKRGGYVLAWPPIRFRLMAAERGYLPFNVPLLKHVVALSGDEICRRGREVFVNGTHVAAAKIFDTEGRSLPSFDGCFRLKQDEFFALNDAPNSFDGRYFGSLNASHFIGVATPLFIWKLGTIDKYGGGERSGALMQDKRGVVPAGWNPYLHIPFCTHQAIFVVSSAPFFMFFNHLARPKPQKAKANQCQRSAGAVFNGG